MISIKAWVIHCNKTCTNWNHDGDKDKGDLTENRYCFYEFNLLLLLLVLELFKK